MILRSSHFRQNDHQSARIGSAVRDCQEHGARMHQPFIASREASRKGFYPAGQYLFGGLNLRTSWIPIIALALCGLCFASSEMQNVGESYGKSWISQNSNKFDSSHSSSNNSADLWQWGGTPKGYGVMNGKVYPLLGYPEWYYPAFTANATPIVVNGTALLTDQEYVPPNIPAEYAPQAPGVDPWLLSQLSGRPVYVVYPPANPGSSLR